MINKLIPANTPFSVPAERFGVYAAASCQMSISVDGSTFTNYGDAFTGAHFFCDNPRSCYVKFSVDVHISW